MSESVDTTTEAGIEDALDSGPDHAGPGRRARTRTCIVTRAAQAPDAMIRFVRGPDGGVAGLREIPELSTGKVRSLRAIGPLGRMF